MQALEGITVVELGLGPAAGLAGMILADFGARVIRIEPPGGDPYRRLASSRMWLRGKRCAFVDMASAADRARVQAFVDRQADALLTTLDDAAYGRFDFAPELAVCRIRGLETRPDLPGVEGVAAAHVGRMQAFAGIEPRDGPGFAALPVGTCATAQLAASALLARLLAGGGGTLEVSLERSLTAFEIHGFLGDQLRHRLNLPAPPAPAAIMPTVNYQPVQCRDGRWLQLGNLLPHLLEQFLSEIGLADAPRDDVEELRRRVLRRMQEKTAAEWMRAFIANGNIVAHPYQTTQEALDDPDLVANGHVLSHAGVTQLGPLALLERTPGRVSFSVPAPGELVLPDAGPAPRAAPARSSAAGIAAPDRAAPGDGPLAGITVLEIATIIAAPLACSVLADLGARVIKVESPGGDPFRHMGGGLGAARVNAGKESIEIDLKSDFGQTVVRALMARADVLVHNFRPGVPEKLGIDYAAARAQQPQIIHVGVSGYGDHGPSAARPSTHPIPGAAMGGVCYQLGGPPPTGLLGGEALIDWARRLFRANEVNPDPNTSMATVTAVLLALTARRRHGVGQPLRVDMFCANAYANFDDALRYPDKPERVLPRPDQTGFPDYGLVRETAGWMFRYKDVRVPAERSYADFLASEEAALAGLTAPAEHGEWGPYRRHGPLIKGAGTVPGGACAAGQHTAALLAELGFERGSATETSAR